MAESIVELFKRRLKRRLGPHGLNPRYHALYAKASATLGAWLLSHGTAKQLCAAICDGVPVLEQALSEVTPDALDVARWTVRNQLTDLVDEDLLILLERLESHAPRHHVVLAAGPAWPCPYCGGAHLEHTVAQLRVAIAFLRAENGNRAPALGPG